MTAAELKTLREALGLSVSWLAIQAGVRVRTVNYWESGKTPVPQDVEEIMRELEAQALTAVNQAVETYIASGSPGEVTLLRYRTDADLWKYREDMRGLPATFHAAMLYRASYALRDNGANVHMIYESEAYESWRKSQDLADSEASRAAWATLLSDSTKKSESE